MALLDVFNDDAFGLVELTDSMQSMPFAPARIGAMGLFSDKPVTTKSIAIEEKDGQLSLLSTKPRGTAGEATQRSSRRARTFSIPHIPHDDALLADELSNVRAFGSETLQEVFSQVLAEKLGDMRQNFEATWEYHRMGALKGHILDADGTTTIYNLFSEFGLSEVVVDFVFSVATTDIKTTCLTVIRGIRDALGADSFTGVHAVCGDNFFDKLVSHAKVETAYNRWRDGEHLRTQQFEGMFEFGGITWENYRGKVGTQDFLNTDEARFFPTGVPNLFKRYLAPAPFIETVGTMGREIYVKQSRMKNDMGVEVHMESNPLFICRRPSTLRKGTHS